MKSLLQFFLRFSLARGAAFAALLLSQGGPALVPSAWAQVDDGSAGILTRGPIHEAFAATISFESTPGLLVPKAPPAAIEEIPPDQRPDGDDITWIPGYWAWDEEAADFLWVSGIWRNVPPGRQWIPGYWTDSSQGFQWISGYWADQATAELEYLDAPPASLEAGPNLASPSRNHLWIPGTWRWRESRYQWQGGYWDEPQPDWVWVPASYSRTPRGYLYVDGYYDYDFSRRGTVFAPVRFTGGGSSRRDYRYQPSTVISLTALLDHLFLRPRTQHYYFGDYYAPRYRDSGFYAANTYYSEGHGYDPIYAHRRWTHRNEDGWQRRDLENYAYYRDHEGARPPHTLTALNAFMERPDRDRRMETDYATRIDRYAASKDRGMKFRSVDAAEQQRFSQRGQAIREFSEDRRRQSGRSEAAADRSKPDKDGRDPDKGKGERAKTSLPRSPIAALPRENRGKGDNPPPRPKGSGSDGKRGDDGAGPPQPSKSGRGRTGEQSGGKPKPDQREPGPKRESETPRRVEPPGDPKKMPEIKPKGRTKDKVEPEPRAKPGDRTAPDRKNSQPRGPEKKDQTPRESREPRPPGPKAQPKERPDPAPDRESKPPSAKGGKREPSAEPRQAPRPGPKPPPPKAEPRRVPKAQPQPKPPERKATPPGKKSDDPDEKDPAKKKGKS